MANLKGYEQTYNKTNIGLGIGGNPQDMTLQNDRLEQSKDNIGVTIDGPVIKPRQLTKQDFIAMMDKE